MATHSGTLAWKIPWTEEPGRLQSMGSLRVGHDWATSLSLFTFMYWRRNGNPLQCSCLENPRDGGAWWAVVYGVAQSQTPLKWQQQQYKIKNFKKLSSMKPVPSAKRLGIADLSIISKLNIHPGVTYTSAVGSGWFLHNIVRYVLYILFKTMN